MCGETLIQYVSKNCIVCAETTVVNLPKKDFEAWVKGEYVQVAFPYLAPEVREILITGTHPKCWEKLMTGVFPE
jgi:hypothetical protein